MDSGNMLMEPVSIMSSKYLSWDFRLEYTFTILVYLMTTSTASGASHNGVATETWTACSEVPNVRPDINGERGRMPCCPGWQLYEGKCIEVVRAATRKCNSATCPRGRVCSPYGGKICICPKGRKGIFCKDDCLPGFYGWGCKTRCACPNGEPCDSVSGSCNKDDDKDEENDFSTTVSNRASNKTAGFCDAGCGLRGSIGCTCNINTQRCECPGYAIALIVVSVFTWVSVGSAFFAFFVKKKGIVDPLLWRYRQKSNDVDEGGDSGFNTDVDQPFPNIPWWDFPLPVSQRNSDEYPLSTPISVPDLLNISSYVTRISRDSLPRSTSHSSEEEGDDYEDETEEEDRHDYLNIPEFKVPENESDGEEYSQPYEHLDHLSRQNSIHSQYAMNTRNDSQGSSFIMRTWTGSEDRTYDENSYVNESVLKWKRRFATRRTILTRQNRSLTRPRCPVGPLSASCSDVRAASRAPIRTPKVNERVKRKPTLKPKPEFLKIKMLMDIEKRKRRSSLSRMREVKSCDSCVTSRDETKLSMSDLDAMRDSTDEAREQSYCERKRNNRIRHLRAALLKKGISVPETDTHADRRYLLSRSEDGRLAVDEVRGQYDRNHPIYENNLVIKPTRKCRLNSMV